GSGCVSMGEQTRADPSGAILRPAHRAVDREPTAAPSLLAGGQIHGALEGNTADRFALSPGADAQPVLRPRARPIHAARNHPRARRKSLAGERGFVGTAS